MKQQMTRNLFKKFGFIRIALAASIGIPLFIATSANAQAPAPPPEATTQRVIVTGSLIPTAEEVTANPVDTLTEADIQRSGEANDILQVLAKRDPDFVGAGNLGQTNANISSNINQGGSIISIRGLPTLVLFENRRFADSAAIATGGAVFKDVSIFPSALISRIEVLKDGASAQYGSDAVGGVVNVFLKDDFTGLEMGYRYGTTVEGAVAQRRAYVIAGAGNDTTHVVAAFQYLEEDPLFERQRAWSSAIIPPSGTVNYGGAGEDDWHDFANFDNAAFYLLKGLDPTNWPAGPSVNSPFAVGYTKNQIAPPPPLGGTAAVPAAPFGAANPGQFAQMPNAYDMVTEAKETAYNLHLRPGLTDDLSRTNAYMSFDHKICGDQLEAFGNFMYAHNHSETRLNAQPLSNNSGVTILGTMRNVPNPASTLANPLPDILVPENRGPSAPYTPFQLTIDSHTLGGDVGSNYFLYAPQRYNASNPRRFTNDNDFYRFLGGLKSQITDADHGNWYAEAAVYYSRYDITFVNQNLVRKDILNALIAAQDANGNPIPGGTLDWFAFDPLNDGPRSISAANFNTIFGNNIRVQQSYERSFDAHIVGFPFELPGGPVGVAVGVQYAVEGFKVNDSPEIFIGSVPIQEINRGRNILSAFAELRIPIVGSQMEVPFIYNFELDFSGRYDKYELINKDSKVPKVMARYQPIKDVTLRGTFSDSFIAPDLFSLFGPVSQGFSPTLVINGQRQSVQAQVQVGSNPNLTPSTAQSWTAGVVYSPHYIPGLTFNADYFWTLQQQIVGVLGGATILNSVNALGTASPYASLVNFGNFPGQPGSTPVTGPGQIQGKLLNVFYLDNLLNIGADRVEGWDLGVDYNWDIPHWADMDFGQLELGIRSVVFMGNDLRRTPQTKYYNISGLIGDEGFGYFPDYKITALAEYRWKGAILSLNANYLPEMKNVLGQNPETVNQDNLATVSDYITVDGRLSYTFHRAAPEAAVTAPEPKDAKDGKTAMGGKAVAGVETTSCWSVDHWLDNLTLAVGCNNIFDEDPRLVVGGNGNTNLAAYDPFGRFVYFEITKKF